MSSTATGWTIPVTGATTSKDPARQKAPEPLGDGFPRVCGETAELIAGTLSLDRRTAPPAIARAALDLLEADANMCHAGGDVDRKEEAVFQALKTYRQPRATGLITYILAAPGIKAGLHGEEVEAIVSEVDRLNQFGKLDGHAIVDKAVAKVMPREAEPGRMRPEKQARTQAMIDRLKADWGAE
jgi:hypothetical protein